MEEGHSQGKYDPGYLYVWQGSVTPQILAVRQYENSLRPLAPTSNV